MSYKISLDRGENKSALTTASVGDPTADIEITVKSASFGTASEVARAIELAARRIQDSDHPIA